LNAHAQGAHGLKRYVSRHQNWLHNLRRRIKIVYTPSGTGIGICLHSP